MGGTTDWTAGSPTTVSGRLRKAGVSERKCRLFCVACCRAKQKLIKHEPCLELLDLVEKWADDPALAQDVARLRRAVSQWARAIHAGARSDRDWLARWSVWCAADAKIVPPAQGFLQPPAFRPLLREVFGNDLSPLAFDPRWQTPTAVAVAREIYEERTYNHLPILADALIDAGCDDPAIVEHCQSGGEHVRGCWVVDLVLGKG